MLCNIWCWFRLPETKDRTFGELEVLFENRVPARKFKTTKADQFAQISDPRFAEFAAEKQELAHVETIDSKNVLSA